MGEEEQGEKENEKKTKKKKERRIYIIISKHASEPRTLAHPTAVRGADVLYNGCGGTCGTAIFYSAGQNCLPFLQSPYKTLAATKLTDLLSL